MVHVFAPQESDPIQHSTLQLLHVIYCLHLSKFLLTILFFLCASFEHLVVIVVYYQALGKKYWYRHTLNANCRTDMAFEYRTFWIIEWTTYIVQKKQQISLPLLGQRLNHSSVVFLPQIAPCQLWCDREPIRYPTSKMWQGTSGERDCTGEGKTQTDS